MSTLTASLAAAAAITSHHIHVNTSIEGNIESKEALPQGPEKTDKRNANDALLPHRGFWP
jgi:hypothetical protein